jgi:ribose 5-phosphate isomerase
MALTIVWRNPLPLIRTERTLQRIIRHEFGAVDGVTAPDLMTELDAIVGIVEHGLILDMTESALISSGEQIIDRTV